jgi:hypothetical protein
MEAMDDEAISAFSIGVYEPPYITRGKEYWRWRVLVVLLVVSIEDRHGGPAAAAATAAAAAALRLLSASCAIVCVFFVHRCSRRGILAQ